MQETIDRFAPGSTGIPNENGTKLIYQSPVGDRQVVYDIESNYFRIENLGRKGKRRYDDLNGNDVTNITVNGKTRGRTKDEYESITHFLNKDKK